MYCIIPYERCWSPDGTKIIAFGPRSLLLCCLALLGCSVMTHILSIPGDSHCVRCFTQLTSVSIPILETSQ